MCKYTFKQVFIYILKINMGYELYFNDKCFEKKKAFAP